MNRKTWKEQLEDVFCYLPKQRVHLPKDECTECPICSRMIYRDDKTCVECLIDEAKALSEENQKTIAEFKREMKECEEELKREVRPFKYAESPPVPNAEWWTNPEHRLGDPHPGNWTLNGLPLKLTESGCNERYDVETCLGSEKENEGLKRK